MSELKIARGFSLPIESVAQSFGILAMRGAGKSNAAVVMAEEMWDAKIPWVAIDPKGDWYGIRSSADGKRAGLALPVFGGLHGDVPLQSDRGALLADLIVKERLTCVVDVSDFSKGEQTRFLKDFAEELFKKQRRSPEPMHLFLEEAHEYLPQRVMRDQAHLVGLWSKIVKQGRSFGLGCTVISQRSASLNKDVLTQIGTLIALRTLSPQDRKAIKDWVDEYDVDKEMLSSLSGLEDGEAWVWSPQFLRTFERIKFRQRKTFDSGATPKLGQVRTPKTIADIDLSAIEEAWSESIERAKQEDPSALRKELKQANHILKWYRESFRNRLHPSLLDTFREGQAIPSICLVDEASVKAKTEPVLFVPDHVRTEITRAANLLGELRFFVTKYPKEQEAAVPVVKEKTAPVGSASNPVELPPRIDSRQELPKMQRKILTALAQHPNGLNQSQLLLLTGYRVGGAWNTAMSRLRSQLYITNGALTRINPEGLTALGAYEPLPSGIELFNYWKSEMGQMAGKILDLLKEQERGLSVEDLLYHTGYRVGGAWNTAMSRLRKLDLITTGQPVKLTDEFREAIG